MLIFDEIEAKYYCQNYDARFGNPSESINAYYRRELSSSQILREGTENFNEFRAYLLSHVERNLFLSAANYNIAHNLMTSGFSGWNHITLYYGAFYAARAIMGMFGVFIDAPRIVVDVSTGNIGNQELRIRRTRPRRPPLSTITSYNGTHQIFWDIFYQAVSPLNAYVTDPKLQIFLNPISGDPAWQIQTRNDINYDSVEPFNIINNFESNFNKTDFPSSLPGVLNTQFHSTEALTLLAFKYAKKFNFNTNALSHLPGRNNRGAKIKRYILKAGKGISVSSNKKTMLTT